MNVVFIPNVKLNDRSETYHYSVNSWKKWCKKHDVMLVELDRPLYDPTEFKITLQRWWVFDILDHNDIHPDQVLMVDADTIIHPNCPNFFNETDHKFAAVINNGCYEWTCRSIHQWGNALFPNQSKINPWEYINAGFVIFNKNHKNLLETIKNYYLSNKDVIRELSDIIKAGTDQTIINFLLKINNVDIKYLSECYNLQDLYRKNLLHFPNYSWFSDELHFLNCGWIYHFNAIPPHGRNFKYWMKRTYQHLYEI